MSDAYDYSTSERRHPRDCVPKNIGFPTPAMTGRIHGDDLADPLLMAICAGILAHENRAMCPKEIAALMEERGWLHNAGSTPFAHVSTCIRGHIRRAQLGHYRPLLTTFELNGSLAAHEMRAVGLKADERPMVKRGTLWYLDEQVLGRDAGVEDPFARCRREAGISPAESPVQIRIPNPILPSPLLSTPAPSHEPLQQASPSAEPEDDGDAMGRGKRKRRASSAAIAAFDIPTSGPVTNGTMPLAIPHLISASNVHRRTNSLNAFSAPTKIKFKLSRLEEVDSSVDDSDGATSDAQRRRKNRKKARRATSEGGRGSSRGGSVDSNASDEDADVDAHHATLSASTFSSASSSVLLAQSLLAVSTSTSAPSRSTLVTTSSSEEVVISPDSLHYSGAPFTTRPQATPHHLSISAPIFSTFPAAAARSPDVMDVEESKTAADLDSADEDDFHEAMLRGDDDFDFEWGSESYAGHSVGKGKGKARDASIGFPEPFDVDDVKEDFEDVQSTPATTPRSPPAPRDEDDVLPSYPDAANVAAATGAAASAAMKGMQETLCEAFADETEERVKRELPNVNTVRADSSESLASLVEEEEEQVVSQPIKVVTAISAASDSMPLPSPLAIDLPRVGHPFHAHEYDFVGFDEDDERSRYRQTENERYLADSADDEDEDDDDLVQVKIEDEGSVGPELAPPSSRQSSVGPLESFTRRLMTEHVSSPSASSVSEADSFDAQNMVVPNSLLASGLPVPQVAPSPPETTEWAMHIDLEDFDGEAGISVDLLGPESVGLDELDIAWGGRVEQGEGETDEEWRKRTEERTMAREFAASRAAFMTGSQAEDYRSMLAACPRADGSPKSALVATAVAAAGISEGGAPAPSRSESPLSRPTATSTTALTQTVIVYPVHPVVPTVIATIVQRGVAVYATNIVSTDTGAAIPLYRRMDTDFVNGSVLLQAVPVKTAARDAVLAKVKETMFRVTSGGTGVEGTWVSLSVANSIASKFGLDSLSIFLEENLGGRFPEPIPTMRVTLRQSLASSLAAGRGIAFGYPAFSDTRAVNEESAPAQVATPSPSPTPKKQASPPKTRARRASATSKPEAFHVAVPQVSTGSRKSTRRTATVAK